MTATAPFTRGTTGRTGDFPSLAVTWSPIARRGPDRQRRLGEYADLSAVGAATPEISKASAAAVAQRTTGLRSAASDARLVVYAVGEQARLTWETTASRGLARSEVDYVDGSSGR